MSAEREPPGRLSYVAEVPGFASLTTGLRFHRKRGEMERRIDVVGDERQTDGHAELRVLDRRDDRHTAGLASATWRRTTLEALDLDGDRARDVVQRQLAGCANQGCVVESKMRRAKAHGGKVHGVEHVLAADEI